VDAREAAQPRFHASGLEGGGCWIITDSLFAHEWVAVDNVMVAVNINVDGANGEQAALVEAVREVLERME
jgi:hypothetical protein